MAVLDPAHRLIVAAPDLLYRDPWLVVVNKPSGMVVHRGWAKDGPVALQTVRDRVGAHVHPIHRLDRGASGLLVFALDRETLAMVARAFARGEVRKTYLALVRGVTAAEFVVDHPLRAGRGMAPRAALSRVELIEASPRERASLVLVMPREGRLHQVRRHLKHASHPIVGDVRYGKGDINRLHRAAFGLSRLALHAFTLSFTHPRSQETLHLVAPVPSDLANPLTALGITVPDPSVAISRGW
ncbi:MAG: pseudouridylate synthase [Polyangiaceae bacterium]|nr:pseudouridylate synthase [Polyangiaceae bacterium]